MGGTVEGANRDLGSRFAERVARIVALPVPAGHLRFLDGWRGLCILLVIGGHFLAGFAPLADIGVQFFFALSGRLMAEILLMKKQAAGLFIRRRIARIVPALATYVVITAILVNILAAIMGGPAILESPMAALFFFHNYVPAVSAAPDFQHT